MDNRDTTLKTPKGDFEKRPSWPIATPTDLAKLGRLARPNVIVCKIEWIEQKAYVTTATNSMEVF